MYLKKSTACHGGMEQDVLKHSPLVFFKNKGGNSYCDLDITRRFICWASPLRSESNAAR